MYEQPDPPPEPEDAGDDIEDETTNGDQPAPEPT